MFVFELIARFCWVIKQFNWSSFSVRVGEKKKEGGGGISWPRPMAGRPNATLKEGTCVLRQLVGGGWELGEGASIVMAVTAG